MNTDLKNDIMSRLQKGEDIEDIAQEFSDIINQANTQYVNAQKAEAEKKKAAQQHKVVAINALIDALADIGNAWGCPKEMDEMFKNITVEDIDEMVTELDKYMPMLLQYISLIDVFTGSSAPEEKETAAKDKAPKEAINNFLDLWVR